MSDAGLVEVSKCIALKNDGNDAYRSNEFSRAIDLFSAAIEAMEPEDDVKHLLHTNRAMCYGAMNNWRECIRDSETAIRHNAKWTKAYFWLVKGLVGLNNLREARQYMLIAFKECGSEAESKTFKDLERELNDMYGSPLRPKPSDFDIMEELGDGNFSKIYRAQLKANKVDYAIKVIEVQTVERMKRRHRNIHNEILMEKRALTRLNHPGVVTLYATFKDYGSLYYQMEYLSGGELWSHLQEQDDSGSGHGTYGLSNAVGLHGSIACCVMIEAINALEFMHNRGIVHRDIKPENLLFTADGHVKFVDFGTAKDLVQTDLNGPEFVGTPEYMSPSTVGSKTVGPEADLWAIGIVLYQMLVGYTPFAAPSPYLGFLRTKRGALREPDFVPDATLEILRLLLTKDPVQRLAVCCSAESRQEEQSAGSAKYNVNYDQLRKLSYFQGSRSVPHNGNHREVSLQFLRTAHTRPPIRVPTLAELSRRAVGRACVKVANIVAEHGGVKPDVSTFPEMAWVKKFSLLVPEDGQSVSSYAITKHDRKYIMHYLNRRQQINNPGLYRLFWKSVVDTKCIRTDSTSREYLGFNRATQGSWRSSGTNDITKNPTGVMKDFLFAQIGPTKVSAGAGTTPCQPQIDLLKKTIASLNRLRPKFVVVTGDFTLTVADSSAVYTQELEAFRKTIARISDSIPILFVPGAADMGLECGSNPKAGPLRYPTRAVIERYHRNFGLDYFGFWFNGIRYLVANSSLFFCEKLSTEACEGTDSEDRAWVNAHVERHASWLAEEIDQSKLCSSQLVVLTAHPWFSSDVSEEGEYGFVIPKRARTKWLRRLQHYRASLVLSGASKDAHSSSTHKVFCFPDAPETAKERKKERKATRRAKRVQNRQNCGEAEEEHQNKRLDSKKTPSKGYSGDNEETLPSRIIANARASGELPPQPPIEEGPQVTDLTSGDDSDNDSGDGSNYICAVEDAQSPPAPPQSEVSEVNPDDYSDTESSSDEGTDHGSDNDSASDSGSDDEGDEDGTPGTNERRFKNVDRKIVGPEVVRTQNDCGGARLVRVGEEWFKHKFLTAEDIIGSSV